MVCVLVVSMLVIAELCNFSQVLRSDGKWLDIVMLLRGGGGLLLFCLRIDGLDWS